MCSRAFFDALTFHPESPKHLSKKNVPILVRRTWKNYAPQYCFQCTLQPVICRLADICVTLSGAELFPVPTIYSTNFTALIDNTGFTIGYNSKSIHLIYTHAFNVCVCVCACPADHGGHACVCVCVF